MTDKQIKKFSSSILVSDIKSYIDTHKLEYELFLKEELKQNKEENKSEIHKTKRKQSTSNTVSS